LWLMCPGYEVIRRKGNGGRDEMCGNGLSERNRLRGLQLANDLAVRLPNGDGHQSRLFLKGHRERRLNLAEFPRTGKDERGADVWVARKRHLADRREDSDVPRMAGVWWENKSSFRIVEFACNLLHLNVGKSVRPGQDGQRVPAEACLRKHITRIVAI